MYHTTNDGKMFLPNAELPGQDIEIGTNEAKTIMAGRNYNAFQDKLDHRDDPVRIDNPQKLEGTSDYDVYHAEKRGDTEYHYVNSLPRRPWTEQDKEDYAKNMGRVGATVYGAYQGADFGSKHFGPYAGIGTTAGAVAGGVAGGLLGYYEGQETVADGIKKMEKYGFPPMKGIEREGNKVFTESRPPGQPF